MIFPSGEQFWREKKVLAPDASTRERDTIPLVPMPHPSTRPPHSFSRAPNRRQRYFPASPDTGTYARLLTRPRMQPLWKRSALWKAAKPGLAFSSGMAAETALFLSQLKSGDHLLSTNIVYGGTYGLISSLLTKFGIDSQLRGHHRPGPG